MSVRTGNSGKIPLYSIHNHPQREYEFAVSGRDPKAFIFDIRSVRNSAATGAGGGGDSGFNT